MTRTVDTDIGATPPAEPHTAVLGSAALAAGTSPGREAAATPEAAVHIHRRKVRVGGTAAVVVLAVSAPVLTPLAPPGRSGFVLAHAVTAAPLLALALAWAGPTHRDGARRYHAYWTAFRRACALALGAALAGIGAIVWPPLLAVDLGLLVAAAPFWTHAGFEVLRQGSGRLDPAVDAIDCATAVVVLGAPGALVVAERLVDGGDLVALPLALFVVLAPGALYGGILSLIRTPPGQRVAHGLGLALVVTFSLSAALQLGRMASGFELPRPLLVGALALNLAVVAALPLWVHREAPQGIGALPVERQVRRRNPMPVVGAVVLPLLAVYVLGWRAGATWEATFLVVVLLAVVVLSAVRHQVLVREAARLSSELATMAEQRRLLLADMVHAVHDDRRRLVAELHSETVGSLSTLGTLVQTACVALPASTALAMRESMAQLHGDLSHRAEELRQLLAALRGPAIDDERSAGDAVGASLRAYAADVCDAVPDDARPAVDVRVDPVIELDRRTAAIACRVAEDALLAAIVHAGARTISAEIRPDEATGGVVVEVVDDGAGLELGTLPGSPLGSVDALTRAGHGELTVHAVPGEGTVLRSRIGGRATPPAAVDAGQELPRGRHLRVVDADEPVTGPDGRDPGSARLRPVR
jgi:signal transduction histidine kinase